MLNIAGKPKPEKVEIENFNMGNGKWNFKFEVSAIPVSVAVALEKGGDFNLLDILSFDDIAERVHAWEGDALKDIDTGKMLECTRENILAFMDDIPKGYTLLAAALMKSYTEQMRKNSKASSDTNGTTARSSAGAARRTRKRKEK